MKRLLQGVSVLLAGLALLLVWRTVRVWQVTPPEFPAPVQIAGNDQLPPPLRLGGAPPGTVEAIVAGNLFETERGAGEDTTTDGAGDEPLPPPTNVVLNGVFFQTTGRPMAIITDTSAGNRQLTLQEGDNVGDYQVGQIARDRVTLLGHTGQEFALELTVSQGVAAAASVRPASLTTAPRPVPPVPAAQTAAQTAAQRAAAARRQQQQQARARPGQNRTEPPGQQNDPTQARLEALRRLREAASRK
jgi:hypothetical protein